MSRLDSTDEPPRWDGVPENWGKGFYRDVPISQWVKKCRERHIRDLIRSQSGDPDFPFVFDWQKSEDAVWFFSCLRHFQKPFFNHPFILADWQEWDIVRPLFGWVGLDGNRRFREANIYIPKKNGKSPLAGGIAGILFLADKEDGGEVACGATKEDQARIVWDFARRMMTLSPELCDEFDTFKKSLFNPTLESRFFYVGQDSEGNDGLNLNGAVIDEYHAHKTSGVKDILRQAMATRVQPLCVTISTMGYGEQGPSDSEIEIVKAVLDRKIEDESYFAFFTSVDDPEKWEEEGEWYKANPNLGISIPLSRFKEDFKTAKQSPTKLAEFKCKRFNIKQSKFGSWIAPEVLKQGRTKIDWASLRGHRCFGGVDLGISADLSAAAFVFQSRGAPKFTDAGELILPDIFVKMMYWVPTQNLEEKYRTDRVPYLQWVEQGKIIGTPGPTRRSDLILKDIKEKVIDVYDVAQVGADQNNAHDLMTGLADNGIEVAKNSQGFAGMNFPCQQFETAVLAGRLKYDDDPVLEWMLSNVTILRNAKDEIMLAKHASRGRIDGIAALCMALGRLAIAPKPTNFIYNYRGIYSG